jgi:hypothetical protein
VTVTSELLKVLTLPAVLTGAAILAVLAERHALPAVTISTLLVGWLLASMGLTLLARESQTWPLAGYLQNLAVFLGLCGIPFLVAYGTSAWLEAQGTGAAMHLGVTLGLALLAILPAGLLGGPYWALFLRSTFGWTYIRYP